ncbi:MAG TPA: TolC family protein [Agriterribacter sp.]|nr:TolC family protein [Agriterribacter sp.]
MNSKRSEILIVVIFLLLCVTPGQAQVKQLSIEECYTMATQHYPLAKQRDLIGQSKMYNLDNASKGYLPQVSINGQATYQSDVVTIPIKVPGIESPYIPKDQYKLYGEVTQTIFDGGIIKQQKKAEEAEAVVEEQKLDVELYQLKDRINQLFFGALLVGEQIQQTQLLKKDIQSGITTIEATMTNGAALKSSADILRVEGIKADQRTTELTATRKAYLDMLGLFINQPLDENTVLVPPSLLLPAEEIARPELKLYDYQLKSLDIQKNMLKARNTPRFNFFVQGGLGRPALDIFETKFKGYYIGGIRLNWTLSGFYDLKNNNALIESNQRMVELKRETFLFNTQLALTQQNAEIAKFRELLESDEAILGLRKNIKNTASAQLEFGTITTNDYLKEVNAEDQARLTQITHKIQMLLAIYNQKTTSGH